MFQSGVHFLSWVALVFWLLAVCASMWLLVHPLVVEERYVLPILFLSLLALTSYVLLVIGSRLREISLYIVYFVMSVSFLASGLSET